MGPRANAKSMIRIHIVMLTVLFSCVPTELNIHMSLRGISFFYSEIGYDHLNTYYMYYTRYKSNLWHMESMKLLTMSASSL